MYYLPTIEYSRSANRHRGTANFAVVRGKFPRGGPGALTGILPMVTKKEKKTTKLEENSLEMVSLFPLRKKLCVRLTHGPCLTYILHQFGTYFTQALGLSQALKKV